MKPPATASEFPSSGETPGISFTPRSTGDQGAVHPKRTLYTNNTFQRVSKRNPYRLFRIQMPFADGWEHLSFPLLWSTTFSVAQAFREVISEIFVNYNQPLLRLPGIYNLLLGHHRRSNPSLLKLRICISAGEALPAQLGEEWEKTFGVQLLDGIGSTEMLHMFMSNHEGEVRYGSSGKLIDGYAARLLDEHENPTAPGT